MKIDYSRDHRVSIAVLNVMGAECKGLPGPGTLRFYCGRVTKWPGKLWQSYGFNGLFGQFTALGNPFAMRGKSDAERDRVCDLFEFWTKSDWPFISPNGHQLSPRVFRETIWNIAQVSLQDHIERIELTCWCHPKRCHCQTISDAIMIMRTEILLAEDDVQHGKNMAIRAFRMNPPRTGLLDRQ